MDSAFLSCRNDLSHNMDSFAQQENEETVEEHEENTMSEEPSSLDSNIYYSLLDMQKRNIFVVPINYPRILSNIGLSMNSGQCTHWRDTCEY